MKTRLLRLLAVTLILSIMLGISNLCLATYQSEDDASPYASYYLASYTAWAVRSSTNQVYIYYDVTGTKTIGCLGAKLVVIEMKDGSKWTPVKTYTGTTSNGMLVLNDASHTGAVVYQGTSGTQYRAVVTIFGGSSTTNGDSRIVTTNTV